VSYIQIEALGKLNIESPFNTSGLGFRYGPGANGTAPSECKLGASYAGLPGITSDYPGNMSKIYGNYY
jgi:hypothetical protein